MGRHLTFLMGAATLLILGMGLAALYSATYDNVRVSQDIFYHQLVFALLGLGIMVGVSRLDYRKFYDAAYGFYALNIFLLIFVLVLGRHALGAQRWLNFFGISFQPSEVAKIGLILGLARYFSGLSSSYSLEYLYGWRRLWRTLLIPLGMTLLPMGLIFLQPDLGTALLFFGIFLFMAFVSPLRYRYYAGLLGVCLAVLPFAWHILKPYQKDRLLVFLNPNIDPLGAGYTIIQSKIAIGSGQLFGKGWLSGTQNQLNFLPERHTDFIFSVIGEEWGLMGTLFLLSCYSVLILSGLRIAEQMKDPFGRQLAVGIVSILSLQVIINMGMVLGLCPVVGLTLPLVSYGRTSFFVFILLIGVLMSLSRRRTIF